MAKGIKRITRKLLKSKIASAVMGYLIYLYTKLVGLTTIWQKEGLKDFYQVWNKEKSIIIIIWHGRATMIPYFWNKKHPLNALVSMHNDGLLMARLLRHYGLGIIGGSSTSNASQAAVGLMNKLKKEDETIAIIPDGPIGPSMSMNMSPLYFAQKSGKPIIGVTYSTKRAKIFHKSWDEMMFPFPFNQGVLRFTKPHYIEPNLSKEELEAKRKEIEQEMRDLSISADKELGREPILPGTRVKKIKQDRTKPCL